jgi:nucleotide-binding universal stress UspA family protein
MKRILVPCDFSANARQAYKSAVDLATASMGEIFVIHVMSFPILYESTFDAQPYSMDPLEIQKLEDNARETFERMKKDQPAPADIPVTFFLLHDNLLPTIRAFAEEKQIDLIVMGTNGSSGIKEFFIGSNTEKVVRFSAVPVIALRTTPTFNNIKNIVFPNMLEMNQTELMSRVKDLQKFFGQHFIFY